jgi:hypothetical protein
VKAKATPIKPVPYFAWDNRSPGEMLVWLRGGQVISGKAKSAGTCQKMLH